MAPVVALRRPFVGMILDGVGRHLIPFRYSPPQAGEMKRGMAAGLKSSTSVR